MGVCFGFKEESTVDENEVKGASARPRVETKTSERLMVTFEMTRSIKIQLF